MDSKKLYIRVMLNDKVVSDYTMKQSDWIKIVNQLKDQHTIIIDEVKQKLSNFIFTFSDTLPFDYNDKNDIDIIHYFL